MTIDCFDKIPTDDYPGLCADDVGIELLDLDWLRSHTHQDLCNPHRISYFCFIYIEKGEGQHRLDGVPYGYQDGSVIFVNSGQIHAFDANAQPQGTLVRVTPQFFSNCSANIRKSYFAPVHLSLAYDPVMVLDPGLNESCKVLLNEIKKASETAKGDNIVLQLLFSGLVLKLTQKRSEELTGTNNEQRQRFKEFLDLVEQHFSHTREAKAYSKMMLISYKSLNLLCKASCGRTAKQIIDFRLNLEITRKLSMKGGSIQSIAFELGFDDVTNFVKYFKRNNGLTPSSYRRRFG
ncbi:AraC family transcriptional regulator [Marinobacter hydrocarbonoclasticus]|nr:AraC family transcriptional regulator [Marinobacter nauticus]